MKDSGSGSRAAGRTSTSVATRASARALPPDALRPLPRGARGPGQRLRAVLSRSFGIADRGSSARLAESPGRAVCYRQAQPIPHCTQQVFRPDRSRDCPAHQETRVCHCRVRAVPRPSAPHRPSARSCSRLLLTARHWAWSRPATLYAQGVTTSAMSGLVTAADGPPLADAILVAEHVPSGTQYRRGPRRRRVQHSEHAGRWSLPGDGHRDRLRAAPEENVFLSLGQTFRLDFRLTPAGGAARRSSRCWRPGRGAQRRAHRRRDVHRPRCR